MVKVSPEKLFFQNTGDIPLDKNLIFNRFYITGNKENSSGLGLSIAESICRNYNLKIDYEFKNSEHSFTIKRP